MNLVFSMTAVCNIPSPMVSGWVANTNRLQPMTQTTESGPYSQVSKAFLTELLANPSAFAGAGARIERTILAPLPAYGKALLFRILILIGQNKRVGLSGGRPGLFTRINVILERDKQNTRKQRHKKFVKFH